MEITLITTTHGQRLLSHTKKGASELKKIRVILPEDNNPSLEELPELIRECEALRHKTKQAMRLNSLVSFLQGIQRRKLQKKNHDNTQPCALFFRDIDGLSAAMFATVQYGNFRLHLFRLKIIVPWVTSLQVRRTAFIHDGLVNTFAAVTDHLSWLMSNRLVDRIELISIDQESPWFKYFTTQSHNYPWRFFAIPRARWQTRLSDPETGNRLKHHSRKTRYNLRRQDSILVKYFQDDVQVKLILSPDDLDDFIQKASRIVDQTYQRAINIGIRAHNEEQRAYLHKLMEEGILRAYLLVAKGEAIAYAVGTLESGTFELDATSYLPTYSKLSPGIVLLCRVMDILAEEGVSIFDFGGWGEYDYKRILGSHQVNEVGLIFYARRIQPSIMYFLDVSFLQLETWIRKFFNRIGVWNTLRQKWRRKLINQVKKG